VNQKNLLRTQFDLSKKVHSSGMGFGQQWFDDMQMGDFATERIVPQHNG
jgi:hypothetical protein